MIIRPLVSIVDDDESVRESLPDLLEEFGFAVQAFSSAEEFLSSDSSQRTECLLLDVVMPDMTGPDLQREMERRRQRIPIVFMTAHENSVIRLRGQQQGVVDCLLKPFGQTELLCAINKALGITCTDRR